MLLIYCAFLVMQYRIYLSFHNHSFIHIHTLVQWNYTVGGTSQHISNESQMDQSYHGLGCLRLKSSRIPLNLVEYHKKIRVSQVLAPHHFRRKTARAFVMLLCPCCVLDETLSISVLTVLISQKLWNLFLNYVMIFSLQLRAVPVSRHTLEWKHNVQMLRWIERLIRERHLT